MKSATRTDRNHWLLNYKPIWMFWHPGSGPLGGLLMGMFILAVLAVLGVV